MLLVCTAAYRLRLDSCLIHLLHLPLMISSLKLETAAWAVTPRPVTIALSSFKTAKPSYVVIGFSSHIGMCRWGVNARGSSPMLPPACAFGSLEFASRKVQELRFWLRFPRRLNKSSASSAVERSCVSEWSYRVSHTHSVTNILWPSKSSSVEMPACRCRNGVVPASHQSDVSNPE